VTGSLESIPAVLAHRRRHDPDVQAVVDDEGAITYAELDDASHAFARRLVGAGIGPGDRVGLVMPNGIDWAAFALAVMRIGAVLVPLSTLLRPPELEAQLRIADVSHLVVVPGFRGRAYVDDVEEIAPGLARVAPGARQAVLPALRAVWVWGALPDEPAPAAVVDALGARVRPADDLVVVFTSGSRGAPKGVIHTHGSALRATAAGLDTRRIGPGDRLYIPMPLFWVGGLGGGLLSVLLAGATLLTEAVPDPARTLRLLERERATLFRGWPDQAARIAADPGFAAADLSALGPASLAPILPPDERPRPGVRANLFGMTETFGPYCGDRLDVDLPAAAHGSCGRPFPGIEVRIVDPETRAIVPPGIPGEILVRGPNLMRGVCGRVRSELVGADGCYATGDLGALDADGYLWYHGRLDDLFKVRGATVSPSEVEAALRTVPGVRQAFVTDVSDGAGGVEVGAVVVVDGLTEADVAAAARARLSAFKVPTRWLVTDDPGVVPVSATGKVDKAGLQGLVGARAGSEGDPA
jgi:acyl-CoA synthetase (AMP-forming)/AMP-acid ligase II